MKSLKLFAVCAAVAVLLTIWLLPLSGGTKLFLVVVMVFCAVFVYVEARGAGKTFAALIVAALAFYLGLCLQRGIFLLESPTAASVILGIAMVLLPVIGAWAMVSEIVFGSRVQQMANELAAAGELPEDLLPRSASGRVNRAAVDIEFVKFSTLLETDPKNWKNWFHVSALYGQAGDRKRARRAMRIALALRSGKTDLDLRA